MSRKQKKEKKQAKHQVEQTNKNRDINWDLIWKVLASIFSFAGSMVAVYELVNYFRSDSKTFYSLIFPGLAILVWAIIVFQLIRKKNLYAIPLLAMTVLGGVIGGIGWQSYNETQEAKVIVLIAQFDGPEETYGLHNQIMEDLREATKGYNDTVIIDGKQIVTAGKGSEYARELGKNVKADLVIWAWYRPTENPNITVHLENLSPKDFETLGESETYQPQVKLAQLESFEVQRQIGSEISTLVTFLTGMLRYKSGDYETAIERFEQILDERDISTFISRYSLVLNLGISHLMLGNFDNALQNFDEAIELNPQDGLVYAYNNRGVVYARLLQYERAIQDYDKAAEIDPQFAETYFNRGNAYGKLQQYERAIQDFDKAIELNPKHVQAYVSRGFTYAHIEQYERAIKDYDKAIHLDLNYADAYYLRGSAYQMLGKNKEAEANFKKYEELTGQKP